MFFAPDIGIEWKEIVSGEEDISNVIVEEERAERAIRLLAITPVMARRIQDGERMTEERMRSFSRFFPEICEYAIAKSAEEIVELLSAHMDNRFYGEYVRIVLSPDGLKWLEEMVSILKGSGDMTCKGQSSGRESGD